MNLSSTDFIPFEFPDLQSVVEEGKDGPIFLPAATFTGHCWSHEVFPPQFKMSYENHPCLLLLNLPILLSMPNSLSMFSVRLSSPVIFAASVLWRPQFPWGGGGGW